MNKITFMSQVFKQHTYILISLTEKCQIFKIKYIIKYIILIFLSNLLYTYDKLFIEE